MELPPFDILWQASQNLSELEAVLEKIDIISSQKKRATRKRSQGRRDGLYGVGFDIEDRDYYEPLKYCCDEAFYTEQEYTTHLESHVKCEFENCPFVAHKKLLQVHIEVVHDGGLFNKIYRDTSDKAVLEWRAARRRNYPTLERAAAKQELLAQRLARGQIFKTAEFGTLNRHRPTVLTARDLEKDHAANERDFQATSVKNNFAARPTTVPGSKDIDAVKTINATTEAGDSALSLIAVGYNSDSDGESPEDVKSADSPTTTTTKTGPAEPLRGRRRRGGRRRTGKRPKDPNDENSNAEANGQPPHRKKPDNPFASNPLIQLQAKRRAISKNPNRILSRPTILHMLLAEEMRTERNQLMQCIRYVIKQNYFTQTPTDVEETK
ncbi:hypothetical protein EG68_10298 [Paragonimus skrjabini miyazakii]|uniref:FMR1-interacting protein 1 conserved domain-containing protein n=1 Tax=Paragonimus skrjabini miyazakii TaxID=59628 RepID=A0A8S9YKZ7_9TREM|nr:hypothetical protein EG68_10298 [Paragonimus skrjabini miyazakii]